MCAGTHGGQKRTGKMSRRIRRENIQKEGAGAKACKSELF